MTIMQVAATHSCWEKLASDVSALHQGVDIALSLNEAVLFGTSCVASSGNLPPLPRISLRTICLVLAPIQEVARRLCSQQGGRACAAASPLRGHS